MTANSNLYPHESMQSKAYFSPYFPIWRTTVFKNNKRKKKKTPNNYLRKEIDSHYLVAFLSKVNPKKILKVYVKCGEQREEEEEEEREEKG